MTPSDSAGCGGFQLGLGAASRKSVRFSRLPASRFASKVKKLLAVRQAYGIASSRQVLVPEVSSPGLLVMVHELPAGRGIQISALNFGQEVIAEELLLTGFTPGTVVDMINETVEGDLTEDGRLLVNLDPYEALCLRIVNSSAHV